MALDRKASFHGGTSADTDAKTGKQVRKMKSWRFAAVPIGRGRLLSTDYGEVFLFAADQDGALEYFINWENLEFRVWQCQVMGKVRFRPSKLSNVS